MSETQAENSAPEEIKNDQIAEQAPEGEAPAPDTPPEPEAKPEPREPDWYRKRIGDMTRKYADSERDREALRERLAQAEQKREEEGERRYTAAELRAEATKQAEQIASRRVQESALQRIGEAGQTEFSAAAWNASCNTLADMGANEKPEFLSLIAELPNGHAVLHQLGSDPDTAYRVLHMSPARMAMEIGKLSVAASSPKAEPSRLAAVSRAPAPIAPLQGRGTVVETDLSKMSTAEYMKKRGYA